MFTPEKKIIFSKRYHFEKEAKRAEAAYPPPTDEKEIARLNDQFAEMMRKINEETVYIAKPGGEEKGELFIKLAQRLSEEYEIDMDIARCPGYVSATLHLFYLPYFPEFTSILAILIFLCDYMDITPNNNEPSDVRIALDVHTHDHYVGSTKIEV